MKQNPCGGIPNLDLLCRENVLFWGEYCGSRDELAIGRPGHGKRLPEQPALRCELDGADMAPSRGIPDVQGTLWLCTFSKRSNVNERRNQLAIGRPDHLLENNDMRMVNILSLPVFGVAK